MTCLCLYKYVIWSSWYEEDSMHVYMQTLKTAILLGLVNFIFWMMAKRKELPWGRDLSLREAEETLDNLNSWVFNKYWYFQIFDCLLTHYFNDHVRAVHYKGMSWSTSVDKILKNSLLWSHPPMCGSTMLLGTCPSVLKVRQERELNTEACLFGLLTIDLETSLKCLRKWMVIYQLVQWAWVLFLSVKFNLVLQWQESLWIVHIEGFFCGGGVVGWQVV